MYLIASDLDGTLFPNSQYPFREEEYDLFRTLYSQKKFLFAAITGRHLSLSLEGFQNFHIPFPDFLVGDVGTSIYERERENWKKNKEWEDRCIEDFGKYNHDSIADLFLGYDKIWPQEMEKQNTFKISYYHKVSEDAEEIYKTMQETLNKRNIHAQVIMSIDHIQNFGLVDILPERATKEDALRFLVQKTGVPRENILYCGDTGNDLLPLTSGFPSVLVGNATEEIRIEAKKLAKKRGVEESFFCAKENYVSGILEGISHFWVDFFQGE
jgi:sucrose-6-phosphatase